MKKQIEWLSQCCNHTFTEPGWPESDFCGNCKDHSGAEAVITYEQFLEVKALESNAAVVKELEEILELIFLGQKKEMFGGIEDFGDLEIHIKSRIQALTEADND